jgi:predicted ATPase
MRHGQKNIKFYWMFSSALATAKLEFLTTEAYSKAKYSSSQISINPRKVTVRIKSNNIIACEEARLTSR